MDYTQGVNHMVSLSQNLPNGTRNYFMINGLRIDYPGYKKLGDYRLSINGIAPKHTDVVAFIYNKTTPQNHNEIKIALEDLYINGLNSTNITFSQSEKELIYWITLQEEINYPQPRYSGRKLPYQRFYEGSLAKLNYLTLTDVNNRTNNHGGSRPDLINTHGITHPNFYI